MKRRALFQALALLAAALPSAVSAQTWRTFDVARQARDTEALAVHVTYGAGRISVQPASDRSLYAVHLRYDAERVDPVYQFDATTRTLDVGVHHVSAGKTMTGGDGSEFKLQLARSVPMRITLDVGAAEGDYDLSGLTLDELILQTGATDTRLRFDTPNPHRMRTMRIKIGAASAKISGLANANAQRIEVDVGLGQAELDFSGDWRGSVDVVVTSALGKVTLRVPSDVGIRVETSTFLQSLDAPGMVKRDGYVVSANWATATNKVRLRSSGALGQLEILPIAR